jgi:hypothetical protein
LFLATATSSPRLYLRIGPRIASRAAHCIATSSPHPVQRIGLQLQPDHRAQRIASQLDHRAQSQGLYKTFGFSASHHNQLATSPDFFFKIFSVMKCLRSKKRVNSPEYTTLENRRRVLRPSPMESTTNSKLNQQRQVHQQRHLSPRLGAQETLLRT